MTIQELRQHIIDGLGEKYISECEGRFYLSFDKEDDLTFKVLPNFTLGEFLTKNKVDTYTKLELGVMTLLQAIRETFGSPVVVSSTYRSKSYNSSLNGATASQHILGTAVDSSPKDKSLIKKYKEVIRKMNINGGVGEYPTFVHVDRGSKRRWNG
jgi:uncharacterized protein YcbK (DUF882 family)